jgi:hypothetical protein
MAQRVIQVSRFQPFESRQGIDTVIGLRFTYDAAIVALLKALLVRHRERAAKPEEHRHTAGGWLAQPDSNNIAEGRVQPKRMQLRQAVRCGMCG